MCCKYEIEDLNLPSSGEPLESPTYRLRNVLIFCDNQSTKILLTTIHSLFQHLKIKLRDGEKGGDRETDRQMDI